MGKWGVLCQWWGVYLYLEFSLALDAEITSNYICFPSIIFGIGYYSMFSGSVEGFSENYANF